MSNLPQTQKEGQISAEDFFTVQLLFIETELL